MNKTYLGDGVYVEFDGFSLTLTAENGIEATDTIVLEPEVYMALGVFMVSAQQPVKPPTVYDSGLCCMARHANATPPWMCDCRCHVTG